MCDRYRREKSTKRITRETGLSLLSVWAILKKYSYYKTKLIRKPRLTISIKSKRYKFILAYYY
jgi:hypothetical protein